jgi:beta-phosphoglucomutase-like phosphatase (HAD superfamily)
LTAGVDDADAVNGWTAPEGTTGLIFDCDGTLADTMPVHLRAWRAMLADRGMSFADERFYGLAGVPSAGIIRILAAEHGVVLSDDDVVAMVIDKEDRYLAMLEDDPSVVRPITSVLAVAAAYRGRLPIAVASGGEHRIIKATLGAIDALLWFDAIVGYEDTERHKPEPDVFLEAASRLGVEPAGCVVFEDGAPGIEAAARAGMACVDVRLPPWQ